jgi:hypothetical protein
VNRQVKKGSPAAAAVAARRVFDQVKKGSPAAAAVAARRVFDPVRGS